MVLKFMPGSTYSQRFSFGKNWLGYARTVEWRDVDASVTHIKNLLQVEDLAELTFLDVGSGSGLSSLAAKSLGADVTSFDYDPDSVNCS